MQPTRVDYPKKKILNVFDFELQPSPALLPPAARPRFSRHAETRLVQRRSLSREQLDVVVCLLSPVLRLLTTNCQLCIFSFVRTFFLSSLPSW